MAYNNAIPDVLRRAAVSPIARVSRAPASFPACVWRARFDEASGTNLADVMGNVTDLTITKNGTGNPFVNAGAFTVSNSVGNEVYARTPGAAPAALRDIGSRSVIFLFHGRPETSASTGWLLALGTSNSPSVQGISLIWAGSSDRVQVQMIGSTGTAYLADFSETPAGLENTDMTIAVVWDRSASSRGICSLYMNGTLVVAKQPSGDPGTINVANNSNGKLHVGVTNVPAYMPARFYDASIWYPASIPSDIASIIARWSKMPYEFPQGLAGLALGA